jgi:preprotein translocase subunit SecB
MPSEQEESPGGGESANASENQPTSLPLFGVQPQNIIPVEIIARRFFTPSTDSAIPLPEQFAPPSVQFTLEEPTIQSEGQQAQILMNVQVLSTNEPFRYEISLKLLGLFAFKQEYGLEFVRVFLQQSALSVMLPVVRELLMSLSSRLQVPLIMLPLIQLAPPSVAEAKPEDADQG